MHNELLTIGPVTIYGYGLMIAIGILAAYFGGEYLAKKRGLNPEVIFPFTLSAIIGGFTGSKILYILTELKNILQSEHMWVDIRNGWVVYGGIIGGFIGLLIYCRIKKVELLKYGDLMFPLVAMAQGFGRIGCFLAGCCYGMETTLPIGITFTHSSFAPNGVKLLPTQLISSGLDFLNFAVLMILSRKLKKDGQVAALYLVFYSIGRFVLEYFRGDLARGNVGTLSTSQFISVFVFAFSTLWFVIISKGKKVAE